MLYWFARWAIDQSIYWTIGGSVDRGWKLHRVLCSCRLEKLARKIPSDRGLHLFPIFPDFADNRRRPWLDHLECRRSIWSGAFLESEAFLFCRRVPDFCDGRGYRRGCVFISRESLWRKYLIDWNFPDVWKPGFTCLSLHPGVWVVRSEPLERNVTKYLGVSLR